MIYDHLKTDFYKPAFLSFLDMFWGAEFSWIQADIKINSGGGPNSNNKVINKVTLSLIY